MRRCWGSKMRCGKRGYGAWAKRNAWISKIQRGVMGYIIVVGDSRAVVLWKVLNGFFHLILDERRGSGRERSTDHREALEVEKTLCSVRVKVYIQIQGYQSKVAIQVHVIFSFIKYTREG